MNELDNITFDKVADKLDEILKLDVNEFKQEFYCLVEDLCTTKADNLPMQDFRNELVWFLTEIYYDKTEEMPSNSTLNLLSNYCLMDYIKTRLKKKSDTNRFLTDTQLNRRLAYETVNFVSDDFMDYITGKYIYECDAFKKRSFYNEE